MISKPRVLAIIPARGGSKGLPRKNVLPLGGKPLIAWTVEAALQASCIDHVILSSDDVEIMTTAEEYGCDVPFRRPAELASDTTSTVDVVSHALQGHPGFDYLALLQPTSPLRTAAHIDAAFSLMQSHHSKSVVSVCQVQKSPLWMYHIDASQTLVPVIPKGTQVTRRQDLPDAFLLNGAIYFIAVRAFLEERSFLLPDTLGFVMEDDASCDIDSAADLMRAQAILDSAQQQETLTSNSADAVEI